MQSPLLIQKPNSWTYNFVVVSWHNLESPQTWGFCMDFLNHMEGDIYLNDNIAHQKLREMSNWKQEISEISIQSIVYILCIALLPIFCAAINVHLFYFLSGFPPFSITVYKYWTLETVRGCVSWKKIKSQAKAVEVTVNSKEENSSNFFLDFVQEFVPRIHQLC